MLTIQVSVFEALLLFSGVFAALLAVQLLLVLSAIRGRRRREILLLTGTAWMTGASVVACALFALSLLGSTMGP